MKKLAAFALAAVLAPASETTAPPFDGGSTWGDGQLHAWPSVASWARLRRRCLPFWGPPYPNEIAVSGDL